LKKAAKPVPLLRTWPPSSTGGQCSSGERRPLLIRSVRVQSLFQVNCFGDHIVQLPDQFHGSLDRGLALLNLLV
jgi:hypothetical protein